MIAAPPIFLTAATTLSSSAATSTGPTSAAMARRHTCAIIGSPQITAKGLFGRRVEAMRAGMTTIFCDIGQEWKTDALEPPGRDEGPRLYVLPSAAQSG